MKPLRCCAIGDESKKFVIVHFLTDVETADAQAVLVDKDGCLSVAPIFALKIIDPDLANICFDLNPPELMPYYSPTEDGIYNQLKGAFAQVKKEREPADPDVET